MKKCFIILAAAMMACHSSKKITSENKAPVVEKVPEVVVVEKAPEVSPELLHAQAKVPGITMDRLTQGSKTYTQYCIRCHSLKEPSNYTMQQWEPILKSMFPKARLTDEHQQNLIRDYVMAKSK